jgi:hypothetical protein
MAKIGKHDLLVPRNQKVLFTEYHQFRSQKEKKRDASTWQNTIPWA